MKHRHLDKNKRELKQEIEMLKQSIDISLGLYEDLKKERVSYRRLVKYMILMNLIATDCGETDIGRILKRNIQEFYMSLNTDLMQFEDEE